MANVIDFPDPPVGPTFSCCYCAETLSDDTFDWVGVALYDKETGDLGQMWFAHETCFRATLHPEYNIVIA